MTILFITNMGGCNFLTDSDILYTSAQMSRSHLDSTLPPHFFCIQKVSVAIICWSNPCLVINFLLFLSKLFYSFNDQAIYFVHQFKIRSLFHSPYKSSYSHERSHFYNLWCFCSYVFQNFFSVMSYISND